MHAADPGAPGPQPGSECDMDHVRQQPNGGRDPAEASTDVIIAAGTGGSWEEEQLWGGSSAGSGDQAVVVGPDVVRGEKRRSRRLLLTTKTELNAMAPPAISGLSRPRAASGMAATL